MGESLKDYIKRIKNKLPSANAGIYEIFNNNDAYNIISDVMTLIPYTSHNYNAEIRNRGDETFYFDE